MTTIERAKAWLKERSTVTLRHEEIVAFQHVVDLLKLLEDERAKNRWQPIETAPKDGTWIELTWVDACAFVNVSKGAWHTGYQYWHAPGHGIGIEPTHWRPLPDTEGL